MKRCNAFLITLLSLFCFRFINARRRIVQPMIDQSNRAASGAGAYSPDMAYGMAPPGPPGKRALSTNSLNKTLNCGVLSGL